MKMGKGKGGGSAKVDKKFLILNIINFSLVDKAGGFRRLSTKNG